MRLGMAERLFDGKLWAGIWRIIFSCLALPGRIHFFPLHLFPTYSFALLLFHCTELLFFTNSSV